MRSAPCSGDRTVPARRVAADMRSAGVSGCRNAAPRRAVQPPRRSRRSRRYSSTARMRRLSSSSDARPSLAKTAVTCFWTPRGAELELLADRLVRAALGDQLEHLALARGERRQRTVVARARQQPGDDLRVERGAAGGDAPQRGGELVDVADAVLEQVAEPCGALREQPRRDAGLDVLGEDHDAHLRVPGADLVRGAQALVGVRRRHPDVDDRDVRLVLRDLRRSSSSADAACASDLDPGAPQERGDALAHRAGCRRRSRRARQLRGDHGSRPGRAGDAAAARRSASTRSARPCRPEPCAASAPPTPSSAISIATPSAVRDRRTDAVVASAYLPTLASASQATK